MPSLFEFPVLSTEMSMARNNEDRLKVEICLRYYEKLLHSRPVKGLILLSTRCFRYPRANDVGENHLTRYDNQVSRIF